MDDLIYYIDKKISSMETGERLLRDLNALREDAINKIQEYTRLLRNPVSVKTTYSMEKVNSDEATKLAIRDTLDEAPIIYSRVLRSAVATNEEFDYDLFRSPLFRVGENQSLYEIIIRGTGWKRLAIVTLKMDEIAGNIRDYSQAVIAFRQEMMSEREKRRKKNKKNKSGSTAKVRVNSPTTASRLWRGIYKNSPDTYASTMRGRFNYMTEFAPFWSILNSGNKGLVMESNYGGKPYPNKGGTHFVEEIEAALSKFFTDRLVKFQKIGRTTETTVEERIDENRVRDELGLLRIAVGRLDSKIYELEHDFENFDKYVGELNRQKDDISSKKLEEAVKKLLAGEINTKRINIGIPGRRRTVSPKVLERAINNISD